MVLRTAVLQEVRQTINKYNMIMDELYVILSLFFIYSNERSVSVVSEHSMFAENKRKNLWLITAKKKL